MKSFIVFFFIAYIIYGHGLQDMHCIVESTKIDDVNIKLNIGMQAGLEKLDFEIQVITFTSLRDPNTKKWRFSANPIFGALFISGAVFEDDGRLFSLISYAQLLSNFRLNFIVLDNIRFCAGQSTDFFLFNNPCKIITESSIGIKINYKRLISTFEYKIPWMKGYNKNTSTHFNIGLGIILAP